MQSSSPPREGAGRGPSNSKTGEVQISRGGFVGAEGKARHSTLVDSWRDIQQMDRARSARGAKDDPQAYAQSESQRRLLGALRRRNYREVQRAEELTVSPGKERRSFINASNCNTPKQMRALPAASRGASRRGSRRPVRERACTTSVL